MRLRRLPVLAELGSTSAPPEILDLHAIER
jgi:hypothetical protein